MEENQTKDVSPVLREAVIAESPKPSKVIKRLPALPVEAAVEPDAPAVKVRVFSRNGEIR
jgi:hypothetical protein